MCKYIYTNPKTKASLLAATGVSLSYLLRKAHTLMGVPETAEFARNFAVLVRSQGPDPKGLKMRNHAFHRYQSGKTTLSASGLLLPNTLCKSEGFEHFREVSGVGDGFGLVVTVASVVEPFLTQKHRENVSQDGPLLVSGAQIDVMVEGNVGLNSGNGTCTWHAAKLLKMVDIHEAASTVQSLIEASFGSTHGWEVGWYLTTLPDQTKQTTVNSFQTQEGNSHVLIGRSTTRMAILGIQFHIEVLPDITVSSQKRPGEFLLAVGSPFGILSPLHFFNSISTGSVANNYLASSSSCALLMVDIRGHPGMEGCPVFDGYANLVGVLIRPLRQKNSGAEIQLVIPWEAIATACSDFLLKKSRNSDKVTGVENATSNTRRKVLISHGNDLNASSSDELQNLSHRQPLPAEKARSSVCLITIDESIWASGIVLNEQGLILTNAHLLEPWRYGKTTDRRIGNRNENVSFLRERSASVTGFGVECCMKEHKLPPVTRTHVDSSAINKLIGFRKDPYDQNQRSICVRLDHLCPWVWCDARVIYICRGPIDIALLQLEHVPGHLRPVHVDFFPPLVGAEAYVIGHGLLGPRCGTQSSVCSGVVAKVVNAEMPLHYNSLLPGYLELPAMLETTASVHPGGSGGAVVNSNGHMIGLVTSNARHGGGMLIPHLNFSIPSAVLAPVFEFAKEMEDFSLLENLDLPNEQLSSIWALMPSLSPKQLPPPTLLESQQQDLANREGKGSRFAKFIAERPDFLKGPPQTNRVLRNDVIPSKM